jgi:hypothetical protein
VNPTHARHLHRRSTVVALGLALASLASARSLAGVPEGKPIKIKNGRTIRVVLGKRREPAVGVKSDKGGWLVMLTSDLAGSSAELQDVTPGVPGSRWVVPVTVDRLVLDAERFVPSHVYRVALRKDGQLLGNALIYLYPPPAERVGRADFRDDETREDKPSSLATTPKGELPTDRSAGRAKTSQAAPRAE